MAENRNIVVVSGCLAGMRCLLDCSTRNERQDIVSLVAEGRAIPICPEQAGGLPTPRPGAGFVGGTAQDLLAAKSFVRLLTAEGDDFTKQFVRGAHEMLRIAKLVGARMAILHNPSPSCGSRETFQMGDDGINRIVRGEGVAARLLRDNNIQVYSEENWQNQA